MMMLVLAETPQPTGGQVLVLLLILAGVLIVHVAVVVLGCVWAWKAGRGSASALIGLAVVAALEALFVLVAIPSVVRGEPNYYLAWAAVPLVAQLALWAGARARRAAP